MSKKTLLILTCLLCALSTAIAQDVTFKKTRFTSPKMKNEARVSMRITDSQIYISGKNPKKFGDLVIPFSSIDSMTYERAVRHRIGEGGGLMAVSLGAGAIVMATKTKSYWLDINYHDPSGKQLAVLRLDKSEYRNILQTLQTRTGKHITEQNAKTSQLNPTAGSKDINEVVPFNESAVRAALKTAMATFGCSLSTEKGNRIECKRPRGASERYGYGGEKITAILNPTGDKTHVKIKTGKGFAGRLGKKNWSTPIYNQMMENLQTTSTGIAHVPSE